MINSTPKPKNKFLEAAIARRERERVDQSYREIPTDYPKAQQASQSRKGKQKQK